MSNELSDSAPDELTRVEKYILSEIFVAGEITLDEYREMTNLNTTAWRDAFRDLAEYGAIPYTPLKYETATVQMGDSKVELLVHEIDAELKLSDNR
ncbi:MAG: hypothetical protein J07AB43_00670 [Candidatus Nanosalina sp. J07AB43]|nr:MAG: hypothetical protein J07AB43_00670 [Candidatus Nanosalina sp. J07AB43]